MAVWNFKEGGRQCWHGIVAVTSMSNPCSLRDQTLSHVTYTSTSESCHGVRHYLEITRLIILMSHFRDWWINHPRDSLWGLRDRSSSWSILRISRSHDCYPFCVRDNWWFQHLLRSRICLFFLFLFSEVSYDITIVLTFLFLMFFTYVSNGLSIA